MKTLTLALLLFSATAQASLRDIAWDSLKAIAIDTGIDVIQDLFKDKVTPQQVAALEQRVYQLDTQLAEYQSSNEGFDTIEQMIAGLKNIVKTINARLSSVEDRVSKVETELATLRQTLLNYKQPAPLDFKINYIYRRAGKGAFKPLTEGTILQSGDHYKIIFTPVEDCYVYIYQVDSAKKLARLFPMAAFRRLILNNLNPVEGGKTYYLPAKDKSFVLDEQVGTETIFFMGSRQDDLVLEKQYQALQLRQQQNNLAREQQAQVQLTRSLQQSKGVANIAEDAADSQAVWQERGENFSVSQKILADLCNGCVNVLRFEHR